MTDDVVARRPVADAVLSQIADYVMDARIDSELAYTTARYCLMDSISCALMALDYPACTKLLGPVIPQPPLENGARVPGTDYRLDPVTAAFNIGCMIRWLDFNDTWLAKEWGHPSDNLGGILALADYQSRQRGAAGAAGLTVADVLTAMIKAYEIQGILALENSFNARGLDHVILVRIATTAVATAMLGGTHAEVINALSNAWLDGGALRTYRHAPNTGSRKSWAAGDATSRGIYLALMALKGEMGYPAALSGKRWGFYDVVLEGEPLTVARDYSSYVIENILFKISYPAEFHAQTAVEAAIQLHPQVKGKLDDIAAITIETQQAGKCIIDKVGGLNNPADRDHCLQYMVAIPLLYGGLTAQDYEDSRAKAPEIDRLRRLMRVAENPEFTEAYFAPEKRAIANAIQIQFKDGHQTERVEIHYPIGHRRRRSDGLPLLVKKFESSVNARFSTERAQQLCDLFAQQDLLEKETVENFMGYLVK